MRVAMGSDHRGRDAQEHIRRLLQEAGHEVLDMASLVERLRGHGADGNGDDDQQPSQVGDSDDGAVRCGQSYDYPDIAYPVARAVADGEADTGILVCGTGIGMCIAANKVPGVRAALVYDHINAEIARRHNDANVLCISGELLGSTVIEHIIDAWLNAAFEGGRHARRVAKITAIEQGQTPCRVEQVEDTVSVDP